MDNVVVIAVEKCLLSKLSELVPSKDVHYFQSSKVENLASEPAQSQENRARLKTQQEALTAAIRTFEMHGSFDAGKHGLSALHAVMQQM